MRGPDERTDALFRYISPEHCVPQNHPLRPIRELANQARRNSRRASANSTPPARLLIAPEKLLRSLLLKREYLRQTTLTGITFLVD